MSWFTAPDVAPGPTFTIDAGSIPAEIFGLESYQSAIAAQPKIGRKESLQVPAVKRGRDLICGTIGQLPFKMLDTDNIEHVSTLLTQPERDRARSITITRSVEDLVLEGKCWWWITQQDYRGYPMKVVKLDPTVQPDAKGHIKITLPDGRKVDIPPRLQILFESPTDPILVAGARAIRSYLKLAAAADRYADSPMPQGIFTPKPEADPDEADVQVFLADWAKARRTRADAYIPAVVDYNTLQWDPEKLQMDASRQAAVLEIARVFGIDPEDLGVSTTSRTYQNSQERRLERINTVLGMYVSAFTERLSMPDVTPRGYRVEADYNGFLKADDLARLEAYSLGVKLGIYNREDVAEREGLPEPTFPLPAIEAPAPVEASNFDADDPTTFGFETPAHTFEVDTERRTIAGLAVPWGVAALRNGRRWQFSKGSLAWSDPSRIKLLIQHDRSQAVGKAVELTDTDHGLFARFKIARTPEGDRALALAEDGVYDGLSIGLNNDAQFSARDGVNHSKAGNQLVEISLTPSPAFDDARVSAVVAEADERKQTMECQLCGSHEHIASACPQFTAAQAPQFDTDAMVAALGAHFQPVAPPAEGTPERETVTPGGPLGVYSLEVNEPAPYVFDRNGTLHRGAFDFSTDLFAGLKDRDQEALSRALTFMQHQFDVAVADVNELSPSQTRADLYVDQKKFRYPLWEAVRKETLTEITPFIIPKWSSSATLVAAHVEATEPTEGSFVTTSQTVTPGAVSGRVEITREVFDQGGNPNVSNLIWAKMQQAYAEALEAKVVATLDAATPTGITLTAGGGTTGQTAALELAAAFSALQFVRGGFSFDQMAAQIDLYQVLAKAQDNDKRFLFPILGPSNAGGTAASRFGTLDLFGVTGYPSWALAATGAVPASSYLFDAKDIFAAASAPQRLDFQYRVALVDLAIWGYSVCAITDITGVREIIYDPVP